MGTKDDPKLDEVAQQRDSTIRRMFATPPAKHKNEPKRRLTPSPEVRQLPKRRKNKARKPAG